MDAIAYIKNRFSINKPLNQADSNEINVRKLNSFLLLGKQKASSKTVVFDTHTLQQLPYELKQHILGYLTTSKDISAFSRTCTEFWKLVKIHAPLYLKIDKKLSLPPKQLISYLEPLNLNHLRTLDLSNCKYINDELVALIAERCKTLEKLHMASYESLRINECGMLISGMLFALACMLLILENFDNNCSRTCGRLFQFNFNFLSLTPTEVFIGWALISLIHFGSFLITHPNFQSLSKDQCLTPEAINQICKLKNLVELKLNIKRPFVVNDTPEEWETAFANLLSQLTYLESLSINGDWTYCLYLTEIKKLLNAPIPNLKKLSLYGFSSPALLSFEFLKSEKFPNLEVFTFVESPSFDGDGC